MENDLFRKNSLERITSPDQLNDYIKVSGVSLWCILGALLAVLLGVGVWGLTGSIPETVQLQGVAYAPQGAVRTVYCFVPMATARRLEEGMTVQVSPDYAPREEYGFIRGRVSWLGERPVTLEELALACPDLGYVDQLLPEGSALEVRLELEVGEQGLDWSSPAGQSVQVVSGSLCDILVITRNRKPYQLLF